MSSQKEINKLYYSIIDIIQDIVNKYVEDNYKNDECKPTYIVSVDNQDMNNQRILCTITHLGQSFTYTIFPRNNTYYGYESLYKMLDNMYNQTM